MNRSTIEQAVLEALGQIVPEAREASLDRTLLLRDQLEIDSVDFLNWVLALEARFSIEVPPRSYPLFASLERAVERVAELLESDVADASDRERRPGTGNG